MTSTFSHSGLDAPFTQRRKSIAVLGAARSYTSQQIILGLRVGRQIARSGCNLITGATSGIPYAAALGANEFGGTVIGISPAANLEEHVNRYGKPAAQADVIVFTGMGPAGRSPIILQSCTGAIFVGGEAGTLGEFCSAWMCGGNILGVLEGSGGISDSIRQIMANLQNHWGSTVLFSRDPEALVQQVHDGISTLGSSAAADEPGSDVRGMIADFIEEESRA